MKKLKLLIIIISLLATYACSSFMTGFNASRLYEEGKYLDSAMVIVTHTQKNPNDPIPNSMITLLNNNISQIQKQINSATPLDYETKIAHYGELRTIVMGLYESQGSKRLIRLININHEQVNSAIAEQFYLKANDIKPTRTSDYLTKAITYEMGLFYYNYKDIEKLMEENKFIYASRSAESYYQQALKDITEKNYQRASNHLEKTINSYKKYGSYKDSQQLLAKYDPIWRKEYANQLYDRAKATAIHAESTSAYKNVRDDFKQAHQLYSHYGNFKDSEQLSQQYDQKYLESLANDYYNTAESYQRSGSKKAYRVAAEYYQLAFDTYRPYGIFKDSSHLATSMANRSIIKVQDSIYGYSVINDTVKQMIANSFNDEGFTVSGTSPDFAISASLSDNTQITDEVIREQTIVTSTNNYKETQKEYKKTYTIKGTINVIGKLYTQQPINISKESSTIYTMFEGNYPDWMKGNYEYNNTQYQYRLKSESTLKDEALQELKHILRGYFDSLKAAAINEI